jgi:polyhydroxyalkanoate synthase subunit PhaC
MDLSPGRSLVEWAVQHGHTAFMISYRNPDETMSKVRLDDYLLSGPLEALEAISDITGSDKVNLLGLCLGGTLTMATLAYLDAVGVDKINSATFLNTLIDFSEPGLMGVFTDRTAVARLERTMKKTGFLPADNMRRSFDLMRANDLIWNYVVSNWMMGEEPPAFDLLSWNADSTLLPRRRARPHRALAQLVSRRLATGRRRPLRALQLWTYRRNRQSAQSQVDPPGSRIWRSVHAARPGANPGAVVLARS